MLTPRSSHSAAAVERQLATRFPAVPPDTVHRLVEDEWRQFQGAPVQAFVPVLVERRVRQVLRG